ncbi:MULTISPECIES: TetR/AcrR family transcriptional regulator [unclassified Mycobacterium]|uniref:TetR/AcrR family transcriptional regulator n=1 Tax=unclassified Mycobacterium TaxID=2642494 RepID=UPI0007402042|nr:MULTISPECIES: TetR/AcrR family transcriptional regulator [unclassified Mycobacterium]KUH80176.1 TetR family transcriptional regulator [Mycobacterium sp. GA-0227b]KUH81728.1 TetR family transcriptional regulator [Mycobacterium sp. GA-1999]KUH94008.1 TetR family transcriptional regulator [Mycobacterium sp. IS-1556]
MTSPSGPARRIGAPDAKNRGVLLDAAEQLLLEEGYAAVTSRRVADKAGLKPQLVHYYFRTMEDLFLAVFRRMAEAGLEMLTEALASPQPLWALWRFSTQPEATRLTMEFMGLANHRKALRAEIIYYAERFREEQNKAIAAVLERYGAMTNEVPPVVWTVFATSVSQALVVERALGMTTGHAETFAFCEKWIRRLEGEPRPADGTGPSDAHQFRIEQSAPLGP